MKHKKITKEEYLKVVNKLPLQSKPITMTMASIFLKIEEDSKHSLEIIYEKYKSYKTTKECNLYNLCFYDFYFGQRI